MPSEHNPAFRVVDAVTSSAMQVGSTVRQARLFHPDGIAVRASITIRPPEAGDSESASLGVPLLDSPATYDGVLRFSRGASLPEPLPDVLGLAVRISDAHGPGNDQDLLLASSSELPLGRQLLIPTHTFRRAALSSVLPYRLGSAGPFWFGALVVDRHDTAPVRLSQLRAAIAAGELGLTLRYARRFGGWRSFADIRVGEPLTAEESTALTFNVDENTGGGIAPAGWLQALRRHAYAASQAGRSA
jgi:hypothetical protein